MENDPATVNPSLYLMRREVFYQGVGMIRNDNAQAEYYLTDIVRLLSGVRDAKGGLSLSRMPVPNRPLQGVWVRSFNSPGELLAIGYVRRRASDRPQTEAGPIGWPMVGRGWPAGHAPLAGAV